MPAETRLTLFGVDRETQHRNRVTMIKRVSAELKALGAVDGNEARRGELLRDLRILCTIKELECPESAGKRPDD